MKTQGRARSSAEQPVVEALDGFWRRLGAKFPKTFKPVAMDVGRLAGGDVERMGQWMNDYPRRMFGYRTANEIYEEAA